MLLIVSFNRIFTRVCSVDVKNNRYSTDFVVAFCNEASGKRAKERYPIDNALIIRDIRRYSPIFADIHRVDKTRKNLSLSLSLNVWNYTRACNVNVNLSDRFVIERDIRWASLCGTFEIVLSYQIL